MAKFLRRKGCAINALTHKWSDLLVMLSFHANARNFGEHLMPNRPEFEGSSIRDGWTAVKM